MLYICSVAKAELSLNREDNVLKGYEFGSKSYVTFFYTLSIMAASLDGIMYFTQLRRGITYYWIKLYPLTANRFTTAHSRFITVLIN